MKLTKKKYKYGGKKNYNAGGAIGMGLGALAGSALGNPMLGAKLGGMGGSTIGGALEEDPKSRSYPSDLAQSGVSYGMATGGYLNSLNKMMLPLGGLLPYDPDDEEEITTRTTREHQKHRQGMDEALKERLERMRQGDYSMVGESVVPKDSVQTKSTINTTSENRVKPNKLNLGGSVDEGGRQKRGDRASLDSVFDKYLNPTQQAYKKDLKGGKLISIGQDAKKVEGNSHEQGGVDIDENTEVEGEETIDNVGGQDYVFSKRVKVPGTYKSFAEVHEEMIRNNADPNKVAQLAQLQEKVTGRS